jgi:hypothetical protein
VHIIAGRNGGLVERREDEGVVAEWDPAIHNAKTNYFVGMKPRRRFSLISIVLQSVKQKYD